MYKKYPKYKTYSTLYSKKSHPNIRFIEEKNTYIYRVAMFIYLETIHTLVTEFHIYMIYALYDPLFINE